MANFCWSQCEESFSWLLFLLFYYYQGSEPISTPIVFHLQALLLLCKACVHFLTYLCMCSRRQKEYHVYMYDIYVRVSVYLYMWPQGDHRGVSFLKPKLQAVVSYVMWVLEIGLRSFARTMWVVSLTSSFVLHMFWISLSDLQVSLALVWMFGVICLFLYDFSFHLKIYLFV